MQFQQQNSIMKSTRMLIKISKTHSKMFKLHFLLGLFHLIAKSIKKLMHMGPLNILSERMLTNGHHVETIRYSLWSAANI